MLENVVLFAGVYLYQLTMIVVGDLIFHNCLKNKKKLVCFLAIDFAITVLAVILLKEWANTIGILFGMVLYLFLFEGKKRRKLAQVIVVIVFTSALELFLQNMLLLIMPVAIIGEGKFYYLLSIVLDMILAIIIIKNKWFQKILSYIEALNGIQYLWLVFLVLSGIALISGIQYIISSQNLIILEETLRITILLFMLILTFGIILFVKSVHGKEYYMKQDSMKDEMIRVQQQYYKSLYENNDNLKRFRHDIKSQLGGLTLLLKQGNSEDAISYLEKITEQYEMIDSNIIHVGNDILDAIINHCSQMAVQKGVSLCVKGKIADIKQMNIYDLCNIFANAINNAVEACERQENIEKIVEINITDNHNTYYLQFINPATSEMYELLQKRVTAKKNVTEHGFGIMNIETAVRRSGGFMEYTYQNNKIILEIFMDI